MKCRMCETEFSPSEEELQHARNELNLNLYDSQYSLESFLPNFCCWECFKHYQHFKSHGNKERLKKHKEQNRWLYHIGDKAPRASSQEARNEEESYRKKMEEKEECR